MTTEIEPLQFEGDALYLVEGKLTDLKTARTTVNLLEQIDKHVKVKSLGTGAAAIVGDMYGVVANSAALAFYDGEDTHHFAALLDGKPVCGTFQRADKLKNGDRVKAVVSRRGDVLFVHAIMNMNAKTQEFYMPMNVLAGSDGMFRHCMRVATGFTIFGWVVFFGLTALMGEFSIFAELPQLALLFFVIPPLIMYPFEYWTYRTFRGEKSKGGETYASAIFKVFGFPKADKIDLQGDTSLCMGENGGWYGAWRSDKLLEKYGKV